MGCGFVPRDRLIELLGKSVGAQRAFAVQVRSTTRIAYQSNFVCIPKLITFLPIELYFLSNQVRIIGPSSVGICKGMLFVKHGITKIQLPSSMLKVEKSTLRRPLHTDVVLNIHHIYPSSNHEALGRLFNDDLPDPPFSMLGDLANKPPCEDVLRVLKGKDVSDSILDQCECIPIRTTDSFHLTHHKYSFVDMADFRAMKATIDNCNNSRRGRSMPNSMTKDDVKGRKSLHENVYLTVCTEVL